MAQVNMEPRQDDIPKERVGKVVSGEVIQKKPTESQKLRSMFIKEDFSSVREYILEEVIIPKIKELFESALTDGLSMMLWGSAKRSRRKSSNSSRISYNLFSDDDDDIRRSSRRSTTDEPIYTHLVFKNREDAIVTLETMECLIDQYGVVSILDLYDLADVKDDLKNTYAKYGWKSLKSAKIVREGPEGWWLKLPKPMPID